MNDSAIFHYDDGQRTGRFEAFYVVFGTLVGHLTIDGERKKRDWIALPSQLSGPFRNLDL